MDKIPVWRLYAILAGPDSFFRPCSRHRVRPSYGDFLNSFAMEARRGHTGHMIMTVNNYIALPCYKDPGARCIFTYINSVELHLGLLKYFLTMHPFIPTCKHKYLHAYCIEQQK